MIVDIIQKPLPFLSVSLVQIMKRYLVAKAWGATIVIPNIVQQMEARGQQIDGQFSCSFKQFSR